MLENALLILPGNGSVEGGRGEKKRNGEGGREKRARGKRARREGGRHVVRWGTPSITKSNFWLGKVSAQISALNRKRGKKEWGGKGGGRFLVIPGWWSGTGVGGVHAGMRLKTE